MSRLAALVRRMQEVWPALNGDVSVRNRGNEECVVEGEWYGEIAPSGSEGTLFPAVAALLHGLRHAAIVLDRALREAEHLQEVEERVGDMLFGAGEHAAPRKRPTSSGRRRRGTQRR
jgi:hypothetical protein